MENNQRIIPAAIAKEQLTKYLWANATVMKAYFKINVPKNIRELSYEELDKYANQIKGDVYRKTGETQSEERLFVLLNNYLESRGKRVNRNVKKLTYWKHLPEEHNK